MLVKPQMVSRLQNLNNHESQCEPEDNEVSTAHDPNLISPTTKKKKRRRYYYKIKKEKTKISVNSKFKDNLVENNALITKLDVSLL